MRQKLLLLDFDGTLCVGHDPVFAYAERIDALLAERGLTGQFPRSVRAIAEDAFAQNSLLVEEIDYDDAGLPVAAAQDLAAPRPNTRAHPVSWPLQDGYQLVQLLARQAGLSDEDAGAMFRISRKDLLTEGLASTDVHAPEGTHQLLEQVRTGVVVVLATNAPADAFQPWLEQLDLTEAFDAVINDSGKPFGMPQVLQHAKAAGGERVAEEHVLSVGDIWRNDLAEVHAEGGQTILVDRFATGLGTPDHRVRSFTDAAGFIRTWSGVR